MEDEFSNPCSVVVDWGVDGSELVEEASEVPFGPPLHDLPVLDGTRGHSGDVERFRCSRSWIDIVRESRAVSEGLPIDLSGF